MAAVAISSVLVFEIVIEDTLWQPQAHRGRHTGDPRVFAQLLRQAGVDPADATVYAQTLSDERYSQAQFNELTAEDLRQLGFALGDTARVQKLQRQPLGNLQALPTVEAEAGRLAAEEAEADASGHTAADHMSAEQGVASASQSVRQSANAAEAEQVAPEKAEQEQSAAEKAEVERLAAEQLVSGTCHSNNVKVAGVSKTSVSAPTAVECQATCAKSSKCAAFSYTASTLVCHLHEREPGKALELRVQAGTVSGPGKPPTPQGAKRYALLFRGTAFRQGCNAKGIKAQQDVFAAAKTQLIEPLTHQNHVVDVFVTETSPCAGAQYMKAIQDSFGASLKLHRFIHTVYQGESVTVAVRTFLEYDRLNSAGNNTYILPLLLVRFMVHF